MALYEPQSWQAPQRQSSWEQPAPPSRSGASSTSQREESSAFATQFEEVDRAIDNLVKSGKLYPTHPRRDQAPPFQGAYSPRGHNGRHSMGDFRAAARSPTTGQNFYASQRFAGGRQNDADQMMQAKRRMAAQREKELRNYHQEQQYNRSVMAEMASNKSDRSMSPSTLSEEGRRELIARQHRALYGSEGASFPQQASSQAHMYPGQGEEQTGAVTSNIRVQSPRVNDPFSAAPGQHSGQQQQSQASQPQQPSQQQTSQRADKANSPTGNQQSKIPSPSAGDEPTHSRTISKSTTAPVSGQMGPIGSRPGQQQQSSQFLNKRTTSPLTNTSSAFPTSTGGSTMATQNNPSTTPALGAWGTGSGVWGNNIGSSVWS